MVSTAVLVWWAALSLIGVLNVVLWVWSGHVLARRKPAMAPEIYTTRRRMWVLSGVFAFVCATRAMIPRADVQRIGMVDSWLSTVLVGRSVATIAELAFVAQWALALREVARGQKATIITAFAYAIVPLIAIAETSSWYAVLTTNYFANFLENGIWTVTASLASLSMAFLWPKLTPRLKPIAATIVLFGIAFFLFETSVDLPMYLSRWQTDVLTGRPYLSLTDGVRDLATRWTVTYAWEDWHEELAWMGMYFSVCVWASLALAHLPRLDEPAQDVGHQGNAPG